jgi:transcriptional regulator with XRE-family HTH domain
MYMRFMEYVDKELNTRGWSRNELAKRAGLSNSYFTMISKGDRSIGADACMKIAKALHITPETVYSWAGLLPSQAPAVTELDRFAGVIDQLSSDDIDDLYQMALAKIERKKKVKTATT